MPPRPPALTPREASSFDIAVLCKPVVAILLVALSVQLLIRDTLLDYARTDVAVLHRGGLLIAALAGAAWFVLQVEDYRQLGLLASPTAPADGRFLKDAPRQFYYDDRRMLLLALICVGGASGVFLFGTPLWFLWRAGCLPANFVLPIAVWLAIMVSCGSSGIRFLRVRRSPQPVLEIGWHGLRFVQGYKQPLEIAWREIDFIAFNCNRSRRGGVNFPTADIQLDEAARERRGQAATSLSPYRSINISWLEGGMSEFIGAVEHFRPDHIRIVDRRRA